MKKLSFGDRPWNSTFRTMSECVYSLTPPRSPHVAKVSDVDFNANESEIVSGYEIQLRAVREQLRRWHRTLALDSTVSSISSLISDSSANESQLHEVFDSAKEELDLSISLVEESARLKTELDTLETQYLGRLKSCRLRQIDANDGNSDGKVNMDSKLDSESEIVQLEPETEPTSPDGEINDVRSDDRNSDDVTIDEVDRVVVPADDNDDSGNGESTVWREGDTFLCELDSIRERLEKLEEEAIKRPQSDAETTGEGLDEGIKSDTDSLGE